MRQSPEEIFWKEENSVNESWLLNGILKNKVSKILSWAALISLMSVSQVKANNSALSTNKPKINNQNTQTLDEEIKFWETKRYNLSKISEFYLRLWRESLYMRYLYWKNISKLPKITTIPNELEINFKQNLDDLWQSKVKRYWSKNKALYAFYQDRVEPFTTWKRKVTKSSLIKYRQEMWAAMARVEDNLDMDIVLHRYWKKTNPALFKNIISSMKNRDLLAYNLTELFDSNNWKFNLEFFDFLLKNAWKEYVSLIPALWDKYLSYWQFQNTKYVVSSKWNSVLLDKIWKQRLIPDTMQNLKFTDHFEVAYYNAIYNLLQLFNKQSQSQDKTLLLLLSKNKDRTMDNIMQFVAAAHNNPKAAQKWFFLWLNWNWKKDVYFYIKPKFSSYAKRSKSNRQAIKK